MTERAELAGWLRPGEASNLDRPRSRATAPGPQVLLAVTYFLAAKLGLQMAFLNASATPVWPPAGIALGAFLVLGYRVWPAIGLGAFLANLTTSGLVVSSVGIAIGNTAEGLAGAWLVNRFAGGRDAMKRSQDIFKFALLAGGLSTTVSATTGVSSLHAMGLLAPGTYRAVWVTWWLGDLVGVLMVAPLFLLWSVDWPIRLNRAQVIEAALLLLAVVTGGLVMFGGLLPPYPVTFLSLPLLVWPAFRFGPREVATVNVVLGGIAVAGTLRGLGAFAGGSPNESLLLLQSFMGVTALTTLAVAAVVAEGKQLEAKLAHLADYDSLTDLLSRRRFHETLAQQLVQALRYGLPGALLFLDLDDFKSVNDRLGHRAGDQVLVGVARLLRARLRDSDILGRLGGDEFAVLLPHADRSQAETVAAQLLDAIRSQGDHFGAATVRTSASIGIALIPEHGSSIEELLNHADAGMFRAKAAGRDRFCVYAPGP